MAEEQQMKSIIALREYAEFSCQRYFTRSYSWAHRDLCKLHRRHPLDLGLFHIYFPLFCFFKIQRGFGLSTFTSRCRLFREITWTFCWLRIPVRLIPVKDLFWAASPLATGQAGSTTELFHISAYNKTRFPTRVHINSTLSSGFVHPKKAPPGSTVNGTYTHTRKFPIRGSDWLSLLFSLFCIVFR